VATRDLCTLADVALLVPGYASGDDADTDLILAELITETSRSAMEQISRREFKPITVGSATRIFDMTESQYRLRKLPIGDAATITTVAMLDNTEAVSQTLTVTTDYVLLPRVREDWQPYGTIWFVGYARFGWPSNYGWRSPFSVSVSVTGTWGFPLIPTTVKDAVARLVIIEYVNDVAASGTVFAELLNRQEINLGAWFRRAMDTLESYRVPVI
jgi:hypothetical protein